MCADLDAAPDGQLAVAARRAGVAGAHLGGLDRAVRGEVAAGDDEVACRPGSLAPVSQAVPVATRGSAR